MSAGVPLVGLVMAGRKQPVTLCVYVRPLFFFFFFFPPGRKDNRATNSIVCKKKSHHFKKLGVACGGWGGGVKGVGAEGVGNLCQPGVSHTGGV